MAQSVLGILVTHASLGDELLRTAESILGPQEQIEVVSNSGESLETLSERLTSLISSSRDDPVFLFVDLLGGSCGHVSQAIRRLHPNTVIFSGVNLPMFVEFLHHRNRVGVDELKDRLIAKGRSGIQCLS